MRLAEELQAKAGPRLASADELPLGQLCLVELGGRWQRCRVVSRGGGGGGVGAGATPAQACRVFLLDEGRTVSAGAFCLARGRDELFHLPSEVLGCILADLVPPGNIGATLSAAPSATASRDVVAALSFSWTAGALEFLGYLHGKEVAGLVREVLIPQRLVVLELPWLVVQMQRLGLASHIAPSAFRTLLSSSLGAPVTVPAPQTQVPAPKASAAVASALGNLGSLDFFYPRLELNVTEPVLVTQLSDPNRVYCQLRSFSSEIQRLSEAMSQAFEAAVGRDQPEDLLTPGAPCAARSLDGCWYRALLLEIYPGGGGGVEEQPGAVAQVICVDYGRKEFVTRRNLRHLPVECFRMPVLTYPCSLQNITDRGCGWTHSQISRLRTLLLGKVVQAHIESYCPFEHLYYVTLYGEDDHNLNCLYGVEAHCLAQSLLHSNQECTSDLASQPKNVGTSAKKEPSSLLGTPPKLATLPQRNQAAASLPGLRLKAGEYHKVQMSFFQDPTKFWVRLQEHCQSLSRLMQNLHDFYSQSKKLEGLLLEPQPGALCCVMLKEGSHHRALVTSVQGKGIEVYLVDRGNTEIVDSFKVKELLPQFRDLPAVALRCALAKPSSLGQSWSPDAVRSFRTTVLNKELMIQVLGMQGDVYIVELFDHSRRGETNLGKLLSRGKCDEQCEDEVRESRQQPSGETLQKASKEHGVGYWPAEITSMPEPDYSAPVAASPVIRQPSEGIRCEPYKRVIDKDATASPNFPSCVTQKYSEIIPGFSQEGQLEVGSTVNVIVSHVENPGLFWCQLDKYSLDLSALMVKIQCYCRYNAQPHNWPNPVCLAKYSVDEKWYRALIINGTPASEEVEVVYVDYGNKEWVTPKNLCAIKPEFLQLNTQACRCSLYNLIQPNGPNPSVWDEKATEAFQEFVDSASQLDLKCTIFALAALNPTELFNIVDLITPFESACHFLTRKGLARHVNPQDPLTSVHLLSYYYSTHDIKIGSEEVIYVTHVSDLSFFYCQLARSADTLMKLTKDIGKLSKKWHSLKTSQSPGNLYLAKYTDGSWYRAVLTSTKATKEVFFVDFGNTQLLKSEDLILVPNDAYEILLLSMQAIKCSLSDVEDVSKDAVGWFEKAVLLDKPLKAVVVAKEPDGKLIVELYDGKTQINAKLKEIFGFKHNRQFAKYASNESSVPRYSCSREASCEARRLSLTYTIKATHEMKRPCSENLEGSGGSKHSSLCKAVRSFPQKSTKDLATKSLEPVEKFKRNDPTVGTKGREAAPLLTREGEPDRFKNAKQTHASLRKICDLRQKTISPGLKTLVYVSHINNPSDFYIQLVDDEPQLDRVSEKLNDSKTLEGLIEQQLHVGDLTCAVFLDDGLWYRAVIKEKLSGGQVSVEYIDYGNTAVVDLCKLRRLADNCSSIPAFSIHCSLHGVNTLEILDWPQEALLHFSERTSEAQLTCKFVAKLKDKWEILLSDRQGSVTQDLVDQCLACKKSLSVETSAKKENEADYINEQKAVVSDECCQPFDLPDAPSFLWKTPEIGQTVKSFAIVTKSPECFWCQLADADDTGSIERKLEESGGFVESSMEVIKRGCLCLTKYSEDEKLYRAIVSSIYGDTVRVIHFDYGTEELVSRDVIWPISEELLTEPPQAFQCCLFGFSSSEGSWIPGTNGFFSGLLLDCLLDVTVLDIKHNGPCEVPVFVVKLEFLGKSINEQMQSFWKDNTEDCGLTMASNLNLHEQNQELKMEPSEGLPLEMPACPSRIPKNIDASEDLPCRSDAFQLMEKPLVSASSCVSLERSETIESNQYQAKPSQPPVDEVLDTKEQQTPSELGNNHFVAIKESNQQIDLPNSIDASEIQILGGSETEVLDQNPFEPQEALGQTLDSLAVLVSLSNEDDSLGSLEGSSSSDDDTKQLLLERDTLMTNSLEEMQALGLKETNPPLCDQTGEALEADLVEALLVERQLEQHPLLPDQICSPLSCGQEKLLDLVAPDVSVLQAEETTAEAIWLEMPVSLSTEIQPSVSETQLKLQDFLCMEESGETSQDDKKWGVKHILEKSDEDPVEPDTCEGFEDSNNKFVLDSLESSLFEEDPIGASSQNTGKTHGHLFEGKVDFTCLQFTGAKEFHYLAKL